MISFLLATAASAFQSPLMKCATCPTCWALIAGAIALWLLVPSGASSSRLRYCGGLLALLSGLLFAVDLPLLGECGVQSAFWFLALTAVGSGVAMISARNPVYSALWFAASLLGTSGLLLLQGAQFLGVATIVVYAGAIVVTFLFVIMLAQPAGQAPYDRLSWGSFPKPAAILIIGLFLGCLIGLLASLKSNAPASMKTVVQANMFEAADEPLKSPVTVTLRGASAEKLNQGGLLDQHHMAHLGRELFSRQLIAVEVAGTLLMAALVGAIAIAIHGKAQPRTGEE